jgi:hypothetical protein
MLISVHLPKTGGTSFRKLLEERFGPRLRTIYGEKPFNRSRIDRCLKTWDDARSEFEADHRGIECVHGHFLPARFLLLREKMPLTFVAWLRHPVDRLVSDYRFTLRAYDPATAPPFQKRILVERWSFERYALCDELRDFYSQYLWAFPLEDFDFIGIAEHSAEDFVEFQQRYLGGGFECPRLNARPDQPESLDPALRRRIEAHHARDLELYARALAMRKHRLQG